MKKVLILTLALSLLPGLAMAQESNSELMRDQLEQARQEKDEAMDSISLEARLIQAALGSSRPKKLTQNVRSATKPRLHPALLSMPGRVVMTVLVPLPALRDPADRPLDPQKPAVTVEVTKDTKIPTKPGVRPGT